MFPSSSLVTRVSQITAAKISAYKADRLGKKSERTERSLPAAAVNRPLALLRCLLRLAVEEWEVLFLVPKIRLEKEPQGRIGWLEDYEEVRLLDVCGKSLKKSLLSIETVALVIYERIGSGRSPRGARPRDITS